MGKIMKLKNIMIFLVVLFLLLGCDVQQVNKDPDYYLGSTTKHSADYILTNEQKEFAKKFISYILYGNYVEYSNLFTDKNSSYIKNQFWNDIQAKKKITKDDFWFVALDSESMNFVYSNPETIYDIVYIKKMNNDWKIISSEIKAD